MKPSDLLTEDLIKLNLEAKTKNSVLQEMVDVLDQANKITSNQKFYQTILDREDQNSTGVGNGIAIPHGKSKVVKEPALVFAKSKTGVDFDSLDGELAKIFFMIAVPEGGSNDHLQVLSKLSRKLMHDDFRVSLLEATSKEEVLKIINKAE